MAHRRFSSSFSDASPKSRIAAHGLSALALGGMLMVGLGGLASAATPDDEQEAPSASEIRRPPPPRSEDPQLEAIAARARTIPLPSEAKLSLLPAGISASAIALRDAVVALGAADPSNLRARANDVVLAAQSTTATIRRASEPRERRPDEVPDQDRDLLAQLACLSVVAQAHTQCLLVTPPPLAASCGLNLLVGLGTCATF